MKLFSGYLPQDLRNAIEIELQKTDDAKLAAIIAIKRLNLNPEYYQTMQKADRPNHKWIKKIPGANGKARYFYVEK